jgi:hypothetical protein
MPKETKEKKESPFAAYDEAAEYHYYDLPLRQALRNKNPEMFDKLFEKKRQMVEQHKMEAKSKTPGDYYDFNKIIPTLGWQDKLTNDEIKTILSKLAPVEGVDPYQRFMELRKKKEFGGMDYGFIERFNFDDYSPRDLAIAATTSYGDRDKYYKAEVVNGKLVRKTNLGLSMEDAIKQFNESMK